MYDSSLYYITSSLSPIEVYFDMIKGEVVTKL